MLFFSRELVERELSMQDCIRAMEEAFRLLHDGPSFHELRKRVHLPGGVIGWGNLFSLMPCYFNEDYFGGKVFSVYPDNTGTSLPTHQGLVMLFDSHNGSLLACADAHAITEIRTAATTALATPLSAPAGKPGRIWLRFCPCVIFGKSRFIIVRRLGPNGWLRILGSNTVFRRRYAPLPTKLPGTRISSVPPPHPERRSSV